MGSCGGGPDFGERKAAPSGRLFLSFAEGADHKCFHFRQLGQFFTGNWASGGLGCVVAGGGPAWADGYARRSLIPTRINETHAMISIK